MNDIEQKILNRIDSLKEEIIKFHQEIIKIPSETPPRNYYEISKFTEKKFKQLGLRTLVKRNNVIGEMGSENGKKLLLYGHLDTVPAFRDQWTKDPFGGELIDGRIYGRGSSDDKSCITAELFAAKALMDLKIPLKGKLILLAVIDEETGGLQGSDYLLEKGIINGDACLMGDGPADNPLGYSGGTMYVTFIIKGKQAHGGGYPDLPPPYRTEASGINSIEKMYKILDFLIKLKQDLLKKETKYPLPKGYTKSVSSINIAEIHGGNKITTVPGKCLLHVSFNVIPEHDIDKLKNQILEHVEILKQEDEDLDITVQIPISYNPYVIDETSEFARSVIKATDVVYGEKREFRLFMPGSDAHWFQNRGIETILIGTSRGENNLHAADEFVYIKDLINVTKMFAISALHYLK